MNSAVNNSAVLCFNISGEELLKLKKAAYKNNAEVLEIPHADFSQSVGALIGVFPKSGEICLSPFKEKMIIMSAFSTQKMDSFLADLRQNGVVIPYKVVVTATNLGWRCEDLIKELAKEHEQIRRMRKSNGK